ncbi:MAG: serine/threonine-protein kinase [Acidimicrobiales bacterium]
MPGPPDATRELLSGRYRLEGVIGRGGMATVWRAADMVLGRTVAVKEIALASDIAERDMLRARALREAHAAARIGDPAAVTVYDVIDEGDRLFIVMELVDAESLADRVRSGGPLPPAAVASIGARLCDALEAAHRVGVVHRDVKPANVLLPRNGGTPKLADFGIASVGDDPRLTTTGMVVGSPAYMAPEQAIGQRATDATDLWGLGSTLYFAVEGEPPFDRETTMATLGAVVNDPPRHAERAGPLEPVLGSLLDKDPARRPSVAETRRRLLAVADGRGPEATAPAATELVPAQPTLIRQTPVPAAPRGEASSPSPWRGPAVALAVLLAALAVGAVAIIATRDGGDGGETPSESTVPAVEFVTYTDPETGFRLRHPEGWGLTTDPSSHITDVRDPETGMLIRVQWSVPPADDPVEAWEDLSAQLAETREAYAELRIDEAEFKEFPAAEWEFTHVESGIPVHTLDIGMVAGDYGFAILLRAPEDRWESLGKVREAVLDGFEPATDAPDPPPEDDDDDNDDDDNDGEGNRGHGNGNGNGRGNDGGRGNDDD